MQNSSLVLLSGGLDSTAALLLAKDISEVVLAITFDYGQKSAAAEIRAALKIAQNFQIPHQVLSVDFLKVSNHPLFNSQNSSPEVATQDLDNLTVTQKSAQAVWVPNRNGVFINIAASLAEAQNIKQIVVGFNIEEAATFPDNSEAYIQSLNTAFRFSTQNSVEVISPTVTLNKTEIVKKMTERAFDFSLLWSCYNTGEKMCGVCESCQRLKRALIQNQQNHWPLQLFVK